MPDNPETYDRIKLFISPDKFRKLLDLSITENGFINFSDKAIIYSEIDDKDQKGIDCIFNEISIYSTNDDRRLILLSDCMRLFLYLNKYSKESTSSVTGIMGEAIDYINKNICRI